MRCYVYKSLKKSDTYLYLGRKDCFDVVPDRLRVLFGKPDFVLKFELTEGRTLSQADAGQVMTSLNEQGYYLQMPSQTRAFA